MALPKSHDLHEEIDSQTTSLHLSPPLASRTFIIRRTQTNLVTLTSDKLCIYTMDNAQHRWLLTDSQGHERLTWIPKSLLKHIYKSQ